MSAHQRRVLPCTNASTKEWSATLQPESWPVPGIDVMGYVNVQNSGVDVKVAKRRPGGPNPDVRLLDREIIQQGEVVEAGVIGTGLFQ